MTESEPTYDMQDVAIADLTRQLHETKTQLEKMMKLVEVLQATIYKEREKAAVEIERLVADRNYLDRKLAERDSYKNETTKGTIPSSQEIQEDS